MTAMRRFANVTTSVRLARRFVAEQLTDFDDVTAESVILMVSELATNSIRHAASEFSITVTSTRQHLHVEVTDYGSGTPVARSALPSDTTGRGLQIIAELADDWGVHSKRSGTKTVWFTVRLTRAGETDTATSAAVTKPKQTRSNPRSSYDTMNLRYGNLAAFNDRRRSFVG